MPNEMAHSAVNAPVPVAYSERKTAKSCSTDAKVASDGRTDDQRDRVDLVADQGVITRLESIAIVPNSSQFGCSSALMRPPESHN